MGLVILSPLKNMNMLAAVPKNAHTANRVKSERQSMALSRIKSEQIQKRVNAVSILSQTKLSAERCNGIISPAHEKRMAYRNDTINRDK